MGKKILKRMLSSLSATLIATTSIGLSSILSVSANEVPDPKAYDLDHSFADHFECDDHCDDHDHCEDHDCCDNSGEGVTIALLDAGVSAYETDGGVSFVNDDTVDSDHGNNMMSSLINIAPGASVLDVRVLDDEGKGSYSSVEKGIRWSVDNNADIIVMSFVGEDRSALLENALEYAEENNVLVIASAGNYSSDAALYPAAYPTVVSVGAVDENGDIQSYSNYGEYVDTYAQSSEGTSFAAQLVAGSAASMIGEDHDIPVSEIRALYNSGKAVDYEPATEDCADSVVYAAANCKSHNYKFYMTAKAATCTSNGVAIYKCSKCNATQNRTVYAYGHSWGSWTTTKAATCTAPAVQTRKCSRGCKETRNYGSALGHNYQFKQTAKAATCTTDGVAIDKCSRCTSTRNRTVKAYGHNWGSWTTTKAATCTAPAVQTRKCSRGCKETRNYGSALGHSMGSWTKSKAATCTAPEVQVRKCTRSGCSYSESRNYGSSLGHNYQFKQTAKAATCTTDGVAIDKCSRCTSTRNRTVKAYGHNYEWKTTVQPTCTKTGTRQYKCTRSGCGNVNKTETLKALGHNMSSWTTTKAATCTAPAVQTRKCTRSGCSYSESKNVGNPLGHNYQFKQTAKAATCTTDGVEIDKCSRCSSTRNRTVKAYGHNYEWKTTVQPTCTKTGTRQYKCTRSGCGNVNKTETLKALGHDYKLKQIAKATTCTTDGVSIYKCSRCTATENRTEKAYGHALSNWTIVTQATKKAPGKKTRKCTRSGCTYKEEEVIPQLGTLSVDDYSNSTFYFHADGSLEESAHSWPLQYQKSDNVFYLRLRFTSNVDWKISSTGSFVNFMDTNMKKISSGKSGTNEVIISLSAMPLTYNDESRNCSITITANDVSKKYNISQCNYIINGINKKTFINTGDIPKLISEAGSTSNAAKALRCELSLNKIEVYDFRNFRKLAVSSRKLDSSHFVVEYALFMANVTTKNDELWAEIELLENHGIKLTQNGTLFTTTATIKSSYADVKDEIYEDKVNRANLGVTLASDGLSLACSYFLPIKNKLASFAIGKGRGKLVGGLGKMIVNSVYKSNGNTTVTTSSTVKIEGGCSFTNNTDEVNIFAYGSPDSIANAKSTISLNVVDTTGRSCSKTYSY